LQIPLQNEQIATSTKKSRRIAIPGENEPQTTLGCITAQARSISTDLEIHASVAQALAGMREEGDWFVDPCLSFLSFSAS
jgi:hypothetical protein